MEFTEQVEANLTRMQERSPAGFAIGLHLAFTASKYIIQTYPLAWMEEYSRRGLLLTDPTVRWGVENLGSIPWSVLKQNDDAGVIDAAAEFGLKYGLSIAVERGNSRSLASFAAVDGEFEPAVIDQLTDELEALHDVTKDIEPGSPEDSAMQRILAKFTSVESPKD